MFILYYIIKIQFGTFNGDNGGGPVSGTLCVKETPKKEQCTEYSKLYVPGTPGKIKKSVPKGISLFTPTMHFL